ncbi:DNA-directed RNA polymerase subunit A' [Methanococcus vannielii SB]|uniref:DNA-directed RNA polymerase subunit Rpo1N n=1 Tax=Methanococcus vannielii (strain ATCC 35089 / DSM 1224 / JCM 13029 / OCM 148 / SB) TaxID=406327 RepID=RPO1N_METVS|nr:DNA-directed RNA polymerase subunit A' [Methanococcus vannielii]P41556.1 RecName: Full=DNA-directed RNA polymerase subunit Rpo1N; AltName: Full=DNA-directed RNA polymerase subunit A' [Methanococcus vannielii SB]ABR54579.1 DNA-directed RNA polymerase subunit A' [Methanococcus vannielii SB]CAA51728.1 DNA-directed RNA polymerase [Methanococcus vannielii]
MDRFDVPKEIGDITFGLLSPEQIRTMSVAKIVTADTYDDDGYPIDGGLMDTRLGVIDPGLVCKSCSGRVGTCPGHFGHIELSKSVIHIGFAKDIYKLLKAVCPHCGKVTVTEIKRDEYLEKMLKLEEDGGDPWTLSDDLLKEAAKSSVCPSCGEVKYDIKYDKPTTYHQLDGKSQKQLTSSEVREILEKIPNEDCKLLGINSRVARPEYMVLTVLPVPPVTVRPSITLESGERSEDDLTHKLVDIIRINQRLEENINGGAPNLIIEDLWDLLQYHINTYFDNEAPGIPPARHRSGRPLRTLAQRLKGKEGRFRHNLAGKRVNFSARTVISPDPRLSINEVGIPELIAKELTVPEKVTPYNIERIRKLIENGSDKHPGVNYVIKKVKTKDGKEEEYKIKITDTNKKMWVENIVDGMVVERHLGDGDVVLYNRQPSLHRMSIMAHKVKVLPYRTFRHNLCVCPPYNADFDGDEMNVHVPQSEEARAEAETLMLVEKHIISPRYGGPIIGAIHDFVSGAYVLTSSNFIKDEALTLLKSSGFGSELGEPDFVENGIEYYSGKSLFSKTLPKGLNLQYKAKVCKKCVQCKREECENDAFVIIRNGRLVQGVIDKNGFGAETGVVLNTIVKDFGSEDARTFLDSATKMSVKSMMLRGFTTGIDDEDIPSEAIQEIQDLLDKAESDVQEIVERYEGGTLDPLPGRGIEESREAYIMQILGKARDDTGKVAEKYLSKENHAALMARTGARGSLLNITMMAASVGQQSVRGGRVFRGYRGRTLPHFGEGSLDAKSHGFVRSCYKKGLAPTEYFFHAMGGREGLVDQAVRTAQSGYMQRRLVNALQDIKAEYDGTVRDSRGIIVQFNYGEDLVDPSKADHGKGVDLDKVFTKVISKYEN